MKKIENIKQLGAIIRETRLEQGLTQEELASRSGVGTRFIGELENGKESCHIGKVFQIIKMLGMHIDIGDIS